MRYLHIMDELFASDTIIFLLIGLFVACIIGIHIRSTKKCLVGMIISFVLYVMCEVVSNIHITWLLAFLALFIGTAALGGCVGFLIVIIATKVKKRIRMFIMIILIALAVYLVLWRFWPNSLSNMISVNENAIDSVSVHAMVNHFGIGEDTSDTYLIDDMNQPINTLEEIIEILTTSSYRQDFRNLLLWDLDSVEADKNYDGRTVIVSFYVGNKKDEYVQIQFLSSSIITVSSDDKTGFRVYHPTNKKTIDKLVEYLQTYGVKQ